MTLRSVVGIGLAAVLVAFSQTANAQKTINEAGLTGELFLPSAIPAPGILVLHTGGGRVESGDENMAKALAAAGFVALAFTYKVGDHRPNAAFGAAALNWLKGRPEVAGKPLGAVGFSAGGARVFWLAAHDPSIKAVVSYYGTYDYSSSPVFKARYDHATLSPIMLVPRLNAAVLLLNGGADTEVPVEQVERMKQAVAARGLPVEAVVYPSVLHLFDRGRESSMKREVTKDGTAVAYNGRAAADAQARTIAWFRTYLK
jgi:dienelactone hydrolase